MKIKEQIETYKPFNEQEESDKELMLDYINKFEDVLTRENKMCHFTASNWIVNQDRTKVLMVVRTISSIGTIKNKNKDNRKVVFCYIILDFISFYSFTQKFV